MSDEQWGQLVRYNPETGEMFWKARPESMFRDGVRISAKTQ